MAHYHLHLHECGTVLEDVEGREYSSLDEVKMRVMMGEMREGRLCLGCYIVIADEDAQEVGRIRFSDAVVVTGI
jgi:hypothetical protein